MGRHVLVVGAGVVGLSTAYYALRKGHRVTIVDRSGPDRDGTSYGNIGMITPSHFVPLASPGMVQKGLRWMRSPESPFYVHPRADLDLVRWGWNFHRAATPERVRAAAPLLRDLGRASRACYEDFVAAHGDTFGLRRTGILMLCNTAHGLEEEVKAAVQAHALGMEARVLNATETAQLDPAMRMDIVGAVHFPEDATLTPGRFMRSLQQWVADAGAEFVWQADVQGWRTSGRRIDAVETSQGPRTADEFALCAGVWSDGMTRGLRVRIPMQPGKGYSMTIEKTPRRPNIAAILVEGRVAVTPMGEGVRIGGTMELAGLRQGVDDNRVRGILKSMARYYPDFTPEDVRGVPVWFGFRPLSPDGLPYLGRTKLYDNLTVAAGHAMVGLSLGPITGKLVSELLSGEPPSIPLTLLDPDRYA